MRKTGTDFRVLEARKSDLIDTLSQELDSAGENLLISGEWLCSNAIELPKILELKDWLTRHVEKVLIVGYIREPKSYMESSFQERLKGGYFNLDFEKLYPKYRERVEKFDNTFGKENVKLWKFSPAKFKNGCVVQDFCTRLGIEFPAALIKRTNESLSLGAISFLYTYRKYGPGYGTGRMVIKENKLLINRLSQLAGSKMHFSWESVDPVLTAHRSDIQWIESRMDEPLVEKTKRGANNIQSEHDLLKYRPEDLQWLAEQLGGDYLTRWHPRMSQQKVADWLHRLRIKLASEDDRLKMIALRVSNTKELSLQELVDLTQKSSPKLDMLPDEKAVALIAETFRRIIDNLESMSEGSLEIDGLGKFSIQQVGTEKKRIGLQIQRPRIQRHDE
ncbi:MAG: hypothetical protein ACXW0Q_01220 [Methylovulum sp.]